MIHLAHPLHHAYGIAGDEKVVLPELLTALKKTIGFTAKANPDFWHGAYETLGIDEVRRIREAAGRQAVTGGEKVFVITAKGLTREAQNALLKVLEEPAPRTRFFLIVPSLELLLSTLRSRISTLRASDSRGENQMLEEESINFLRANIPARLKTIQKLLKTAEEEEGKGSLIAFLDALELALAALERNARAAALSALFETKRYSRDRSPSFKLLLEHLALVLPVSVIPVRRGGRE